MNLYLSLLVLFHIFIIILSNYLVQIPIEIFGIHATYGAFTFPFVFLATDLTVRLIGKSAANKVIFMVMIPALVASYVVSVLFFEAKFQGFTILFEFNTFVFRIALASFLGYVVGQLLDILVFNKLRQHRIWWVAPTLSSVIGSAIDTFIFFFIAFYRSLDAYMAEHWVEIAFTDYTVKLITCVFMFVPIYGIVLSFIKRFVEKFTQNLLEII